MAKLLNEDHEKGNRVDLPGFILPGSDRGRIRDGIIFWEYAYSLCECGFFGRAIDRSVSRA